MEGCSHRVLTVGCRALLGESLDLACTGSSGAAERFAQSCCCHSAFLCTKGRRGDTSSSQQQESEGEKDRRRLSHSTERSRTQRQGWDQEDRGKPVIQHGVNAEF